MYIQNKIYNYNQIYDSLRTLKLNDYITDKRNNVHNDIYEDAGSAVYPTVYESYRLSSGRQEI